MPLQGQTYIMINISQAHAHTYTLALKHSHMYIFIYTRNTKCREGRLGTVDLLIKVLVL